jgi:threonylcarbamoyladenosine tRNA methylthiotransferase MtaB
VGFCKVHVFSFSPREGTPAATLPNPVAPPVVANRRRQLLEIERETARKYQVGLIGRTLDVLVEGADDRRPGFVRGTSCRYVPVFFPGDAATLLRRRVQVRATAWDDGLLGEPLPEDRSRRVALRVV